MGQDCGEGKEGKGSAVMAVCLDYLLDGVSSSSLDGRYMGGGGWADLTRAKNRGGETTYEQSVCHGKGRVVSERASGGVELGLGAGEKLAVPLPVDISPSLLS